MKIDPQPSVSVVMAAFNSVPFIGRAIESALSQRNVSLEVVIVDDASTDATRSFVAEHFAHDSRVRLLTLDRNSGPAVARNTGIANARGKWIAVLDADDAFEPSHLERLTGIGDKEAAHIVAGNFAYYNVHTRAASLPALQIRNGPEILDCYQFAAGARPYSAEADYGLLKPLFRRDFLLTSGISYPSDVRHGEDVELVLFALQAGARYVLDRETCTYLYTTRDSGHSRTSVDYRSQVRRTNALRKDHRIAPDPRLVKLLGERAAALRRLELDRNWSALGTNKIGLLANALCSDAGRKWLLKRTVQKLVR